MLVMLSWILWYKLVRTRSEPVTLVQMKSVIVSTTSMDNGMVLMICVHAERRGYLKLLTSTKYVVVYTAGHSIKNLFKYIISNATFFFKWFGGNI